MIRYISHFIWSVAALINLTCDGFFNDYDVKQWFWTSEHELKVITFKFMRWMIIGDDFKVRSFGLSLPFLLILFCSDSQYLSHSVET